MTGASLESYSDAIRVLDTALAKGGLIIPFKTRQEATTYRHRLYRARKRLTQVTHSTKYGDLFIRLRNHESGLDIQAGRSDQPEGATDVVILLNEARAPVTLLDLDGNPVEPMGEADLPIPADIRREAAGNTLITEEDLLGAAANELIKKLRTPQ